MYFVLPEAARAVRVEVQRGPVAGQGRRSLIKLRIDRCSDVCGRAPEVSGALSCEEPQIQCTDSAWPARRKKKLQTVIPNRRTGIAKSTVQCGYRHGGGETPVLIHRTYVDVKFLICISKGAGVAHAAVEIKRRDTGLRIFEQCWSTLARY